MSRKKHSTGKFIGTILIVLSIITGIGNFPPADDDSRLARGRRLQDAAFTAGMFVVGIYLFVRKPKLAIDETDTE